MWSQSSGVKVLFDINIILDFFCLREDFISDAAKLFDLVAEGQLSGYLSSDSLPTVYYVYNKQYSKNSIPAGEVIDVLLDHFEVVPLEKEEFKTARQESINDYEDAVKYVVAKKAKCDFFVTRDEALLNYKKKRKDKTKIIEPKQLLAMYQAAVMH